MSIDAIVLAGGRSRRFGSDKLAATFDGGTVLAATIDAVSTVAAEVIVVGPALPYGFRAGETPVIHLPDRQPFEGPLVALGAALELRVIVSEDDLAIVVGGDMPRVIPAVLASMLGLLGRTPDLDAVVLGRPAPVSATDEEHAPTQVLPLALRHRRATRAAREAIDAGQRSLRALVDRLSTIELPSTVWLRLDPNADSLLDVDTPADLDRLRSRGSEPEAHR